jgi:hypothetical protein
MGVRLSVVYALLAVVLLQPLLAYLATPLVTKDGDGHQIAICTLEGIRLIKVDIPGLDLDPPPEHCSALQLVQLSGTTPVTEPPAAPAVVLFAVTLLDQTVRRDHHSLHFSAYSTRAPPRLS